MSKTNRLRGKRAAGSARPPQSPLSQIALLVLATLSSERAFAANQRPASDGAAVFDAEALRARGIDPALAAYFSQAARFVPGTQRVKLYVNDLPRGSALARFDDDGQLCVDRTLLERAGLLVPETLQGKTLPACYDYRQDVPQADITLEPGENAVRFLVPQEALKPNGNSGAYTSGGTAAMANYSLLGMSNQGGGSNSNFLFGDGEIGLNAGDWIVRSRHSYTSQDGTSSVNHLYTYVQKTFVGQKAMVQAGQINVTGSLLPVPPILGVQYVPDQALTPQRGGPAFEGIADTPSRVEVRQQGVLIYSTVVPAGPFTLSNLPLINAAADLEVVLTESNGGSRRSYTVPAASLRQEAYPAQGLSVAIGKVRDVGDAGVDTPLVVTATKGWNVSERHTVTAAGLGASGYQAAAAGLSSIVTRNVTTNLQAIVTNAQRHGVRGASVGGSMNLRLNDAWSISGSVTQQTEGYRAVGDTLAGPLFGDATRFRGQYTGTVNWRNDVIGGITASYSRASTYGGQTTQYATASWNRKIGPASLSVSLEKDLGNTRAWTQTARQDNLRVYAVLSMPLGRATVQSYATNTGGSMRFGTGVSQALNESLSYSARAETNPNSHGPNLNGSVAFTPRYTRVAATYSQTGANNAAYSAQVQGGAVLTRARLTLSPYQIGDTFGVVQAGDLSGVRISTPQGTVWTDPGGRAVIPSMSAYRSSRVELLAKSLPRNTDIDNGIEDVEAGRGSVNFVQFGVNKVRRVLLDVKTADGTPLPAALSVLDADGQYVTTSVGDGKLFLEDIPKAALRVKLEDGTLCRIDYALPAQPDLDRPFDVAEGVCKRMGDPT